MSQTGKNERWKSVGKDVDMMWINPGESGIRSVDYLRRKSKAVRR
jgi:hypothetical protein